MNCVQPEQLPGHRIWDSRDFTGHQPPCPRGRRRLQPGQASKSGGLVSGST